MSTFQPAPGYEIDLGNLTAFDNRTDLQGSLIELATQSTEPLVQAIFSLPIQEEDDGRFVHLPKPTFELPREKPIPKERPLTKWEQFAKEKGINKKRRDRLVLDEATGEYVPRYGKGSKNSLDKDIILPHKESMGDNYNPFAEKRKEKKQRIKDNKKKHARNLNRAAKARGSNLQLKPVQALDVSAPGPSGKKFLPKQGLKDTLAVAQRSTASAGRFDKRLANEPKPKLQGRRKHAPTVPARKAMREEKEKSQKIAERVLMGIK